MDTSQIFCLLFCFVSFVIIPLYKLSKSKQIRNDSLLEDESNTDILYSAANFIDRGDYIELKIPLGRIKMIQKRAKRYVKISKAAEYAANLNLGGFSNWVVPTQTELLEIRKIKELSGMMGFLDYSGGLGGDDWHCSSSRIGDKFVIVDLISGRTYTTGVSWSSAFPLRCVRYTDPKIDTVEYEIDQYGNIVIK